MSGLGVHELPTPNAAVFLLSFSKPNFSLMHQARAGKVFASEKCSCLLLIMVHGIGYSFGATCGETWAQYLIARVICGVSRPLPHS